MAAADEDEEDIAAGIAARSERPPLIVSACLVGLRTRLDGRARSFPHVLALASRYCLIPVCPEQLGGSPTPRPPAEIFQGAGEDVLDGRARVVTAEGDDLTDVHLRGATEVLGVARLSGATAALLKARSPSCGVGTTYDGTFSHRLRPGSGVTAALLAREGLELFTEEDCAALSARSDPGDGRGSG
jgi:uncharacterized protein YbbK (DUF523 family)